MKVWPLEEWFIKSFCCNYIYDSTLQKFAIFWCTFLWITVYRIIVKTQHRYFLHEIKKILTYASENTFLEVIVFKRGQSLNNSIPKKMLLQLRKKIVIAMHKWYWMPTLKVYLPSYHDTYYMSSYDFLFHSTL